MPTTYKEKKNCVVVTELGRYLPDKSIQMFSHLQQK